MSSVVMFMSEVFIIFTM